MLSSEGVSTLKLIQEIMDSDPGIVGHLLADTLRGRFEGLGYMGREDLPFGCLHALANPLSRPTPLRQGHRNGERPRPVPGYYGTQQGSTDPLADAEVSKSPGRTRGQCCRPDPGGPGS